MSGLGLMFGFVSEIEGLRAQPWVVAAAAALFVVVCVLAFVSPRTRRSAARSAIFVVLGAALGAAIMWALLDRAAVADQAAERRALEMRAAELAARTLAPGSPLACVDDLTGETVAAACEKAIFASPAAVASATSYVAARLALLADVEAYVGGGGAEIDDVLLPLRRSLEADRFGFLAHLLATRDGCTGEHCPAFALLRDPGRVRANLSDGKLDRYLESYQTLWAKSADGAVADATQAQPNAQAPRKVVDIDFPSAASIPPVSIMNPEPTGPVLPGVAAAAAANPNPHPASRSSSRRPHKQATNPSPPTAARAASLDAPAATEPIWPEPVPLPPQTATAPASGPAPMQLSPFPAAPNASAGMILHAQ